MKDKKRAKRMSIRPIFAWYDIWIGVFVDRPKRRIYIFPIPCVGVVIQLAALKYDAQRAREVPAGMVPFGPEHPDYPNRPRDWDPQGWQVRRNGALALGIGATWTHARPSSGRTEYDIVAYTPRPAMLDAAPIPAMVPQS